MIHRIPSVVLLLCLIILGCGSSRYYLDEVPEADVPRLFRPLEPLPCDNHNLTSSDYRILSVVLDSLLPRKYTQIVLGDSTVAYPFPWFPALGLDSTVSRQLTSRLRLISHYTTTFCPDSISDGRPKFQLTQSQFTTLFPRYNYRAIWEAYYKRFPNALGIIRFTRIAYDSSGRFALIYTDHLYYSFGGQERLFLLSQRGNRWFIQQSYLLHERMLEF